VPDLKLARLQRDQQLIQLARDRAKQIIADDPDLTAHPAMRAEVLRRYEGGLDQFAALQTG
jgi:RecG-like helicase